jgi:hypothetical protein
MEFERDPSNGTCDIDEVIAFIYGGTSSRFWVMRKHINSLESTRLKNLPFYSWQCLTLFTKDREVNYVIPNEKDMKYLLEFLIISLRTLDGVRDSAIPHFE